MGSAGLGHFGVGSDDGVEGEDIWDGVGIECGAGGCEVAAFGVEKDEVVGEVGGGRDLGFEV